MKRITHERLIEILRQTQGDRTAKELANDLGITPQYLSDIYSGRREPGPALLEALGLKKEVLYTKEAKC